MTVKKRIAPFDMSLALSSHDVPMEPIVRDMGLVVKHLHKRGEPIVLPTSKSRPIATKHYALVAHARTSAKDDVPPWLGDTLRHVENQPALVDLLRSGAVEACLWIAILCQNPMPPPLVVDAPLVSMATRLGAKIMIEDYNRFDAGGVPQKTWLG